MPQDHRPNRIDRQRPDAPILAGFGAHKVGVQTLHLINPDQLDIRHATNTNTPSYDRPLTVEMWYPADSPTAPGTQYHTVLRDGVTSVTLSGSAIRDAAPIAAARMCPLVILSHGYPGNRFLMSHLGENLASKGYVVASIDHTDSTYQDKSPLGSTLINRPYDTRFVINALADMHDGPAHLADTDRVAIIGYSMGGYGALVSGGAGVSQAAVDFAGGAPAGLLGCHQVGDPRHLAQKDRRLKAIVPIGPWGRARGIWDAAGLAGLSTPMLLIAGSADDVSGYADGMRRIFEETIATSRHLLTFDHAGHNAAAPIPAPEESWHPVDTLDFVPFEHYADTVWDGVRMNNIAQHFITAFLGQHLKSDPAMAAFLGAVPDQSPAETWPGFAPGTQRGLRLEYRQPLG